MSRLNALAIGEAAAWALAIALGAAAVHGLRAASRESETVAAGATPDITAGLPTWPESLASKADRVASADPFRLVRRPSSVAYRPELEGAPLLEISAREALALRRARRASA